MEEDKILSPERVQELNAFLFEFQNESDRGAALLGAAMLDTKLRELLADFLISDSKMVDSLLDDLNAPLSTFSGKNKLAYCLGLITRDEFDNINVIRSVRNEFAHKIHGLSFSDDKVTKLCRRLKYDKTAYGIINLPSPRHAFTAATAVILSNLEMREVEQRTAKTGPSDWIPLKGIQW